MLAAAAAALYLVVGAPTTAARPPVTELLDASGQVQRVVAAPSTFDETGAAWSPDGTHIVYLDAAGLHVQSLDGSDDRLLVSHPRCDNEQCLGNLDFAWSPDGTRIIVGGAGHRTNQLLVVDVASGTMRSIAPESRYTEYADPTWSPNGKWITYTRESGHAGYASCCQTVLTMSRPDGTGATVLYRSVSWRAGVHPVWSPDSKLVALNGVPEGSPHDPWFAIEDVATRRLTRIPIHTVSTAAVWSPDGTRIVATTLKGVVSVDRQGRHRRSVGTGTALAWTRGAGLVLGRPLVDARNVWTSKGGTAPARFAFGVPDGLSLFSLAPQP